MGTGTVQSGMASDFFAQFIAGEDDAASLLPARPMDPAAWDDAAERAGRRRTMQGVVAELQRQAASLPASRARRGHRRARPPRAAPASSPGNRSGYSSVRCTRCTRRPAWWRGHAGSPNARAGRAFRSSGCRPRTTTGRRWRASTGASGASGSRPPRPPVERRGTDLARPAPASAGGGGPPGDAGPGPHPAAPRRRGLCAPRAPLRCWKVAGGGVRRRARRALRRRGAGAPRPADPGDGQPRRARPPLRPRGGGGHRRAARGTRRCPGPPGFLRAGPDA